MLIGCRPGGFRVEIELTLTKRSDKTKTTTPGFKIMKFPKDLQETFLSDPLNRVL